MAAIHQTIAIVDKSNKVIGTTKHFKDIWSVAVEARAERKRKKAQDRADKDKAEPGKVIGHGSVRHNADSIPLERSTAYYHDDPRIHRHAFQAGVENDCWPGSQRAKTYASVERGTPPRVDEHHAYRGLGHFNEELYGATSIHSGSPRDGHDLVRRRTDLPLATDHIRRPSNARSHSTSELDSQIDMDLAYGEFHPESLMPSPIAKQEYQKQEMASLVTKCKMLLEEADCAQHSVKAIVAHLKNNPDAMAAVGLTLAEISNLATKMAPAALAAFKTGAPAVFAILAAPEFLIAVGVGVGITVVMFGGYKIIRKIQAKMKDKDEPEMEEMIDMEKLGSIHNWRRGIPDPDSVSVATSVEGEFITPAAARSMGHLPIRDLRDADQRSESTGKHRSQKKHRHRSIDADADQTAVGSETSLGSRRRSSKSERKEKVVVKVKKPSTLRKMFSSKESETSSRRKG
jgi:hypothetical protein